MRVFFFFLIFIDDDFNCTHLMIKFSPISSCVIFMIVITECIREYKFSSHVNYMMNQANKN